MDLSVYLTQPPHTSWYLPKLAPPSELRSCAKSADDGEGLWYTEDYQDCVDLFILLPNEGGYYEMWSMEFFWASGSSIRQR